MGAHGWRVSSTWPGELKGPIRMQPLTPHPSDLVELSRSFKVLDRGRNTQKPVRNRSESVCAGLWAPRRGFLAWFRFVRGPIWAQIKPDSKVSGPFELSRAEDKRF